MKATTAIPWRDWRLIWLAAVIAALVAAAVGVRGPGGLSGEEDAGFPPRRGPPVVAQRGVENGYGYELVTQDSAGGLCVEIHADGGAYDSGCGFSTPQLHDVAFMTHRGVVDGTVVRLLAGPVAKRAAAVELVLSDGRTLQTTPIDQPELPVNLWILPVPEGASPRAIVASDRTGGTLERRDGIGGAFQ